MKFYSEYTNDYVIIICKELNSKFVNLLTLEDKPFESENFETLTIFLQDYIIYSEKLYRNLDNLGLVNTGKCPYTGEKINNLSPFWSYMNNRKIYLSQKGQLIMKREQEERQIELFGFVF